MRTKLYVGNLSFLTLPRTLRAAFAQVGRVVDTSIVYDAAGRSRGIGYVEMATIGEAKAAIAALNGAILDGRPLKVDVAFSRAPKRPDQGTVR